MIDYKHRLCRGNCVSKRIRARKVNAQFVWHTPDLKLKFWRRGAKFYARLQPRVRVSFSNCRVHDAQRKMMTGPTSILQPRFASGATKMVQHHDCWQDTPLAPTCGFSVDLWVSHNNAVELSTLRCPTSNWSLQSSHPLDQWSTYKGRIRAVKYGKMIGFSKGCWCCDRSAIPPMYGQSQECMDLMLFSAFQTPQQLRLQ